MLNSMRNFVEKFAKNIFVWLGMWLLVATCTFACAQDRDKNDGEATQAESQDKDVSASSRRDAAKRAKKAERKTRKDKKEKNFATTKLPPAPDPPPEFEFFDGVIFSRKVNLGFKNVLCFASARRPLAMLWREAGQEGSTAGETFPIKLVPRELQRIFGRPVEAAQISVLNASGQMLSRGTATQVTFGLARRPVYLLVEITPSRPQAAGKD